MNNIYTKSLDIFTKLHLHLCLAASFTVASIEFYVTGILKFIPVLTVFFLIGLVYSVNSYFDVEEDQVNKNERLSLYMKYGKIIILIHILGLLYMIFLSYHSIYSLLIVGGFLLLGAVYNFAVFPSIQANRVVFLKLKSVLLVKNIVAAFAISSLYFFTPFAFEELAIPPGFLFMYAAFGFCVFSDTIICDNRDIIGDAIANIKTLPMIVGSNNIFPLVRKVLLCLIIISVMVSFYFSFVGFIYASCISVSTLVISLEYLDLSMDLEQSLFDIFLISYNYVLAVSIFVLGMVNH